ncbi:hypothetical protein BH10ACT2_BH10ACT2_21020 [soil metagenome]
MTVSRRVPRVKSTHNVRHRFSGAIVVLAALSFCGVSSAAAAPAPVSDAPSPGATYVPVAPTRIADTRLPFGSSIPGKIPGGATTTIQITDRPEVSVPADATAVVINVTINRTEGTGYATVFPAGIAIPSASNLNYGIGYTGANLVTVKLGAGGAVNVFTRAAAHLIIDIFGYYLPAAGAVGPGRVETITPDRLYDTRGIGSPMAVGEYRTVALPRIPSGATAVVLNYTVAQTRKGGYFSILPPADQPTSGEPGTSNVNVPTAGATLANQVILPIEPDGKVTLYTSAGGHVILDLFGYVTGASAPVTTRGLFVPLDAPFRMLDTRTANNPIGPTLRMWPGWVDEVSVLGRGGVPTTGVGAIVGNTTIVDSHGPGWLAMYAAGTQFPGTSTVNTFYRGQTIPNHTTSPISTRGVAVLLGVTGGHVILDVSGYYLGTPKSATIAVKSNVTPPPSFPLVLSIPSIGHVSAIQPDLNATDLAHGPGWWPGSAYPGIGGNFTVFGHRTQHGGPFRKLNYVKAGDLITVEGDHRKSVYQVTGPWVIVAAGNVQDYVGPGGYTRITLIACTKTNGQPTSTSYRLIVTAYLVSYTND